MRHLFMVIALLSPMVVKTRSDTPSGTVDSPIVVKKAPAPKPMIYIDTTNRVKVEPSPQKKASKIEKLLYRP